MTGFRLQRFQKVLPGTFVATCVCRCLYFLECAGGTSGPALKQEAGVCSVRDVFTNKHFHGCSCSQWCDVILTYRIVAAEPDEDVLHPV